MRNNLFATFKGEGAKLDISGAFLGRGAEHIDTTLVVDHAVPGCESRELFKGVLADRAHGVFQGKVIVRPDAQKSDGKQMAQVLMLSQDAEFDSKPELEIHADDVVCGHGSTAAEIDEDLLFYMRSRGIPVAEARALLIESFIVEAIDKVEDERVRAALAGMATRRLAALSACRPRRRAARRRRTHMTAMMKETDITGEAAYDVETIRTDFPILFREVYGKPLVYLDNGASAQKPRSVLDAIDYAYKMEYANVHRGLHFLSNAATARYEDARETVRRFLNAPSVEEIIFTRNATEGINLVASSYGMDFRKGDEIVLSIMEHHSNIVPWHFHRERKGCVLKWAPIADDGTFLIDEFEKLLTKRTRMVAITHMSNVLGTVVPIKEVVKLAHARGIPVLVDGSQAAVHMPVDVQDLDCDFYVFTGHKTYGPTGHRRALRQEASTSTPCRPTWAAAR